MEVFKSPKQVAEMLQKAYEEHCTLPVAAERLADLAARVGYIASIYAEKDIDSTPGKESYLEDDLDSPEYKRAIENEYYASVLAGEIRDILETQYPPELARLAGTYGEYTLSDTKPEIPTVTELIKAGEGVRIEFKSTLRMNLKTRQYDEKMEHSCLKTIVAFLNAAGGCLLIGVDDKGDVIGIDEDGFQSEDKMTMHFANLIRDQVGLQHSALVIPRFESIGDRRVMVVECKSSRLPVFLKKGKAEQFYTRMGSTTTELSSSQTIDYTRQRFASLEQQ